MTTFLIALIPLVTSFCLAFSFGFGRALLTLIFLLVGAACVSFVWFETEVVLWFMIFGIGALPVVGFICLFGCLAGDAMRMKILGHE